MKSRICYACSCLSLALVVFGARFEMNELTAITKDALQCPTPEEIVTPKDHCSVESYYEGVEITDAQALHDKIIGQNVLIYSNHYPEGHAKHNCADIWNALEFLDENATDSTMVDLIYSKFPTRKDSRLEQGFWNREHLWPKSYGVACKVKERRWEAKRGKGVKCKNKKVYVEDNGGFTDVHHLFPSNSAVNSDRSSEYFDACTPETCSYDHHEDDGYTAEDQDAGESLDDKTFWQPPAKSRGVVARAMFYMALRYNGDEENTFDLKLSDTPRYCQDAIGKLSVLKQWHNEFNVTEAEKTRNDKACWVQGNRNPFVDHPELVDKLFGEDASSNLVSTDTTPCPYDSPRAHTCNPDAEAIDKCLDATKPEPRPRL